MESREIGVQSELQIIKDVEGIGRVKSKLGVRVVWDLEWNHYIRRKKMHDFSQSRRRGNVKLPVRRTGFLLVV